MGKFDFERDQRAEGIIIIIILSYHHHHNYHHHSPDAPQVDVPILDLPEMRRLRLAINFAAGWRYFALTISLWPLR